jgi:hypothetical protein
LAADDVGLAVLVPVGVKKGIVFVRVAVRPAVDRDWRDVPGWIEAAGPERAAQLVADVALEGLEAGGEQVGLPSSICQGGSIFGLIPKEDRTYI